MFHKVDTDLNFIEREDKIRNFWKDHQIFEKSIETRAQGIPYVFYDGPPTAYRSRSYTSYKGHDPALPHNERLQGNKKSRLGHPRASC